MILDFAGEDLTLLMNSPDPHTHSKNAYQTLADMQIGVLKGHENDKGIDDEYKEPVDWTKPMLEQVPKLGKDYSKWVHTPVDRWVRLFTNDLIEILSKSPWYLVPICWTPILIYNLFVSHALLSANPKIKFADIEFQMQGWMVSILFLLGMLTWPFIEYVLHRFVFHLEPSSGNTFLIKLHFSMHGLHHKAPFDPYHLVFPPAPAAIIAMVVWGTYSLILPPLFINGWFAGTALGYIFYDLTHYYLHHGHPHPESYFGRLKKWHIRHHYIDSNNGFGVSSNFLDFPFGTDFPNFKKNK